MITSKGIGFLISAIALFLLGRLTQVGWFYLVDAVPCGPLSPKQPPVLVYPQVHPMGHLAMAQGFSGMESQGRKGPTGTDLVGTVTMLPGTLAGTSIGETQRKPGSLWSRNWKTPFDRTI